MKQSIMIKITNKVLIGVYKIDYSKISITYSRRNIPCMTPLDYHILLYMFSNYLESTTSSIAPTHLMWKLEMCPTFYSTIKKSLVKLSDRGLITKFNLYPLACTKRKYYRYYLTPEGRVFLEEMLNKAQVRSNYQEISS